MSAWRKLHTKVLDSKDVNSMPDDFTRLLWYNFSLVMDKEGRGIFEPAWVRSHAFPIRSDVTIEMVECAINWFKDHKMIEVYEFGGRLYFDIPTWKEYQSTEREARSVLPKNPSKTIINEELMKTSGETHEVLAQNSRIEEEAEAESEEESEEEEEKETTSTPPNFSIFMRAFCSKVHLPETHFNPQKSADAINRMVEAGVTVEDMRSAIDELMYKKYSITGPWSVVNAACIQVTKRMADKPPPRDGDLVMGEKSVAEQLGWTRA